MLGEFSILGNCRRINPEGPRKLRCHRETRNVFRPCGDRTSSSNNAIFRKEGEYWTVLAFHLEQAETRRFHEMILMDSTAAANRERARTANQRGVRDLYPHRYASPSRDPDRANAEGWVAFKHSLSEPSPF